MAIIRPANSERAAEYIAAGVEYAKFRNKDGSESTALSTGAGEIVRPADPERAADYARQAAQYAKWTLPDGSQVDKMPIDMSADNFLENYDQSNSNVEAGDSGNGLTLNARPTGLSMQGRFGYFGTKAEIQAITTATTIIPDNRAIASDTLEAGTWDGTAWTFSPLDPTPVNGMFAKVANILNYPSAGQSRIGEVYYVDDGVNPARWDIGVDNVIQSSDGSVANITYSATIPTSIPSPGTFIYSPGV
jgi:hypothetical protein